MVMEQVNLKRLITWGLLLVLVMVLVIGACTPQKQKIPRVYPNKTTELKELTKDDVLKLMDDFQINSSFVSVKGVRLGDADETVIAKLGRPASFESLEEGSLNLRFEDKTTRATEMIVHLDNGFVTRMAIKPGLNDKLVGKSKMNYTKDDVTRAFGKPDKAYDTKYYHIYEYHQLGLEIYLKARDMEGYGFVLPS